MQNVHVRALLGQKFTIQNFRRTQQKNKIVSAKVFSSGKFNPKRTVNDDNENDVNNSSISSMKFGFDSEMNASTKQTQKKKTRRQSSECRSIWKKERKKCQTQTKRKYFQYRYNIRYTGDVLRHTTHSTLESRSIDSRHVWMYVTIDIISTGGLTHDSHKTSRKKGEKNKRSRI